MGERPGPVVECVLIAARRQEGFRTKATDRPVGTTADGAIEVFQGRIQVAGFRLDGTPELEEVRIVRLDGKGSLDVGPGSRTSPARRRTLARVP